MPCSRSIFSAHPPRSLSSLSLSLSVCILCVSAASRPAATRGFPGTRSRSARQSGPASPARTTKTLLPSTPHTHSLSPSLLSVANWIGCSFGYITRCHPRQGTDVSPHAILRSARSLLSPLSHAVFSLSVRPGYGSIRLVGYLVAGTLFPVLLLSSSFFFFFLSFGRRPTNHDQLHKTPLVRHTYIIPMSSHDNHHTRRAAINQSRSRRDCWLVG
ncbi:hypothetical protein CPSG_08850 [Coccidioides posadasii str. Silveira]|uniref:Uncharacterized protein n=1 Tax=Coccidioides posadasii (strain RMSCC 757 / Silveira) TaxID=443226 RepID=E9DGA1_COCPS|nr:hypothetical protein CPSG_08850 [Coccidioides posadasii str. Silveira]